MWMTATSAKAQAWVDPSQDPGAGKLLAPMTTLIDGQTFGETIHSLRKTWRINLWVDSDIDTSFKLQQLSLGPTLYAALEMVAKEANAEVLPIDGVILIGHRDWLERSLVRLHEAGDTRTNNEARINVAWPESTTPSEILRLIREASPSRLAQLTNGDIQDPPRLSDELTYDLLDAGSLQEVRRSFAQALLDAYAEDQVWLGGSNRDSVAASTEKQTWSNRYRTSLSNRVVRELLGDNTSARVTQVQGGIQVDGNASAHRAIRQAIYAAAQRKNPGKRAGTRTKTKFDLTLENKSAGEVLSSLAASAGKPIQFSDDSLPIARQLITLEAKTKTLQELADLVAKPLGLKVQWLEGGVQVTVANP